MITMISENEAWDLLNSQCNKSSIDYTDKLIQHCKIVHDLSVFLAKEMTKHGIKINLELVAVGAILHDIGRTAMKDGDHPIMHGIYGSQIMETSGVKDWHKIASFCTNHIGIGIKKAEAERLGLPSKDYIPKLIEEKIVTYCDNLVEFNRASGKYMIHDKNYIIERMEKEISKIHSNETKHFMDKIELIAGRIGFKEFETYREEYNLKLKED